LILKKYAFLQMPLALHKHLNHVFMTCGLGEKTIPRWIKRLQLFGVSPIQKFPKNTILEILLASRLQLNQVSTRSSF